MKKYKVLPKTIHPARKKGGGNQMENKNEKTLKLLMELRKDGRQQLTEISRKIGMPVSTIFDKMKVNKERLVKRFTCLLDFRRVGFNCRAHIVYRIRKEDRTEMQEYLLRNPNVNSVYKINNGYDFLVEGVFKELKEVDEFLERTDERFRIREKKVYYIIDDIAREKFLTDETHARLAEVNI